MAKRVNAAGVFAAALKGISDSTKDDDEGKVKPLKKKPKNDEDDDEDEATKKYDKGRGNHANSTPIEVDDDD